MLLRGKPSSRETEKARGRTPLGRVLRWVQGQGPREGPIRGVPWSHWLHPQKWAAAEPRDAGRMGGLVGTGRSSFLPATSIFSKE